MKPLTFHVHPCIVLVCGKRVPQCQDSCRLPSSGAAAAVKSVVDDKARDTEGSQRTDFKAELDAGLIILPDESDCPPVDRDEIYKEIFEQAKNRLNRCWNSGAVGPSLLLQGCLQNPLGTLHTAM